jgi:hypothetical protein
MRQDFLAKKKYAGEIYVQHSLEVFYFHLRKELVQQSNRYSIHALSLSLSLKKKKKAVDDEERNSVRTS